MNQELLFRGKSVKWILALIITASIVSLAVDVHKFVAGYDEVTKMKKLVDHLRKITWCLEPARKE